MKIIGSADNAYIVHISTGEFANICGFWSDYDDDFKKLLKGSGAIDHNGRVRNGAEIPVGPWWQRLAELRNKRIAALEAGQTLEGLAKILQMALPDITAPPAAKVAEVETNS